MFRIPLIRLVKLTPFCSRRQLLAVKPTQFFYALRIATQNARSPLLDNAQAKPRDELRLILPRKRDE